MSYLKRITVFIVLSALFSQLFTINLYCEIKNISKENWAKYLQEIGAEPSASIIEKLSGSGETLDKINLQTKGSLELDKWIDIFTKLNIEPKKNMQPSDWTKFLDLLGIVIKTNINEQPDLPQQNTSSNEIINPPQPLPEKILPTQQNSQFTQKNSQNQVSNAVISLDLRGMDILSVLKIISQKTGMNIIAGNNVRGNVTLYLKDINAIDALKMILEMNDLAYVYEDEVIKVMASQDYEKIYGKKFYDRTKVEIIQLAYAKAENINKTIMPIKSKIGQIVTDSMANCLVVIDTPENIEELKKLVQGLDIKTETKVFNLNYSKPKDIADKLKNVVTPNSGDIQIDERTNQLIITDSSQRLQEISKTVAMLDKRHREVLIEARIVQVMHSKGLKLGINYDKLFDPLTNDPIANKDIGAHAYANFSNLSSLPATTLSPAGLQLSIGSINVNNNFNAVFDLLQTVGKTDLVSSPRIAAIENKEAKILVGTKEAYVTTQVTNSGSSTVNPIVAESVSFVDVGMKLYVTPSIGDDGFITMKIRPEVSSVDRTLRTAQNNDIPIVRTSESETTVMVKDGVTIIIAGLLEEKTIKNHAGIPLLSEIPFLGVFFRRTNDEKIKTELLVFLTPRIMSGDVSTETKNEKEEEETIKKETKAAENSFQKENKDLKKKK